MQGTGSAAAQQTGIQVLQESHQSYHLTAIAVQSQQTERPENGQKQREAGWDVQEQTLEPCWPIEGRELSMQLVCLCRGPHLMATELSHV
eukprot:1149145-Pelagomonas_calceolata.AAC.7